MLKLIEPNISQDEINAVSKVLASGMVVSGPMVQRFEQLLANYLGIQYAVCVSSGTAALHLALLAADIKPSDEVLVPAFTFPATANAVEMVGAVPIFIDCQPGGVNFDVDKLDDCVSSRTKAVIPVHAFGIPAELNRVLDVAREYNLAVIEDAACALGSKYKSIYCGSFGDLATFSFHPRKLLTTGEGGAVLTNDRTSAMTIRSLRNHGYDDGDYRQLGFNYRMTDFQAAMGVTQIENFEAVLNERRKLAITYQTMLSEIEWLKVVGTDQFAESNIQTFIAKVDDHIDRDSLVNHLLTNGIEATIGTYCVPLTHYYRLRYGFRPGEFPQAYDAYKRCLSLPLFSGMKADDMARVVETLSSYEENLKIKLV